MPTADPLAGFWAKVNKTPTCWLWTGATVRGYGALSVNGRRVSAHRFIWEQTNHPIHDDLHVCHRCDVTRCVNPDHLFLGTQAINLEDARQKGRLIDGRHLIKVSDAGLADIRANYRPRQNGKQLAAKYGITLMSVLRIVNGTQRVRRPLVFERVPAVDLPIRGEVA